MAVAQTPLDLDNYNNNNDSDNDDFVSSNSELTGDMLCCISSNVLKRKRTKN